MLALDDEGRVYVIGRDVSCDLPLADTDVSRAHVNVVRRGGAVLLRDLGSKNGARLGDARLPPDRDVPWRSGAPLQIGGTTMALDEPAAIALAELEAAADEPMTSDDAPPEPESSAAHLDASRGAESRFSSSDPPAPPAPRTRGEEEPRWNQTDMAVVVVALSLLGLSIAGLFWLLHT